ncbi:probable E3 ubiquitin-protein ligase EDA40 [Panicum virgatum]|uniref:probable E3 ubiquitin-protein ligase EDA40 n=1 Tax=Panicum virgatum TaxID=38727 RepID=UPI0019D525BE|nr:probable E3 ubiquitin-protein ligase EDA40 [Panicum virgatum]
MGHGQNNIVTACSHTTSSVTPPPLGSEEEEEPPPADQEAPGNGVLVLTTHCEYPSIPNNAAHNGFAVMVQVKAPSLARRGTPVDLVAVLDVSGSMAGPGKLEEAKRAMGLVVDSLGARDRLSVVAFSDGARRVVPLTRMSADGEAAARLAVESLVAAGSTNIRAGLDEAAKVLEECRHDSDVAGVVLLSDGYDNYNACRRSLLHTNENNPTTDYSNLVPPYLVLGKGSWRATPVHTFAFGSDHDEEALHGISAATGGTFSFVENHASSIQDALRPCVGGLRSVMAHGVWIDVNCRCQYPEEIGVAAVKSGRYKNSGSANDEEGLDEYVEAQRPLDSAPAEVEAQRPLNSAPAEVPSMEVELERLRVEAAEDVALAHAAAERGAYAEAARILGARQESVMVSRSAADATCEALAAELDELRLRVADEREYRLTGALAYALTAASMDQRAASMEVVQGLEDIASSPLMEDPRSLQIVAVGGDRGEEEQPITQETIDKSGQNLIAPQVGMSFESEKKVYEMYNTYAGQVGFNVRRSKTKPSVDGSLS